MTPTYDLILQLLKDRGTLSAYDLARSMLCQPGDVLRLIADAPNGWWTTQAIAGPSGWLYRLRPQIANTYRASSSFIKGEL